MLEYLRYVLKHKRFVFQAGLRSKVPLWQLLVHDLSKFRPDEFRAYARWFYGYHGRSWHSVPKDFDGTSAEPLLRAQYQRNFDVAWLKHQHRNPHHWQHWCLKLDDGGERLLEMPERFWREMVADWRGAGMAITGRDDTFAWYQKNKDNLKLHPQTRRCVELELGLR